MIWLRRHFPAENNWANTDLLDRGEHLQTIYPREFMMVAQKHGAVDATIWVRLPSQSLAGMFPDFTEAAIEELKARPTRLVVEESQFTELFGRLPDAR